jgi:hypothetical protein
MLTRLPMLVAIAVFFAVLFSIVVGVGSAPFPKVSAAAPTGLLVVENQSDRHRLYVVDLQTLRIFHSFDLPGNPLEQLVRPGGDGAHASCTQARNIAVLDLHSWQMDQSINLSRGVDGLAWTTVVR